jgi:hypothetical protein
MLTMTGSESTHSGMGIGRLALIATASITSTPMNSTPITPSSRRPWTKLLMPKGR